MGSYEGFLQPWIINMLLWFTSVGHMGDCIQYGLWGLLFANDDGVLITQCMKTGLDGAKATYYD